MKANAFDHASSGLGPFAVLALFLGAALTFPPARASTLVLSQRRIDASPPWRSEYDGSPGAGAAIPDEDTRGS